MHQLLLEIPSFYGVSIEVYFIALLLAVPFFFVWRRLFKKRIQSKWIIATTSAAAAIISAPIAYVASASVLLFLLFHHPNDEFDKKRWFADREKRYELSKNIIASKVLIGKSKEEVKELLGADYEGAGDYWCYYLGFVPSIGGIDPDVLDIYFKDDKVVRVGQHET